VYCCHSDDLLTGTSCRVQARQSRCGKGTVARAEMLASLQASWKPTGQMLTSERQQLFFLSHSFILLTKTTSAGVLAPW